MAERKIFDMADPLMGTSESMVVDPDAKKRYHTYRQNVDETLRFCHRARQLEVTKGQRFRNLIVKGQFKMLGVIPITAFFGEKMYLDDSKLLKTWLTKYPDFKTTNANLD